MKKLIISSISVFCTGCFLFLIPPLSFADSEDLYPFENTTEELGPGFGDPWNKYAWSMQDYNGYMYVGTNNLNFDLLGALNDGVFNDLDIDPKFPLSGLLGSLSSQYLHSTGAEVWRYNYETKSWSQDDTTANQYTIGYRKMETYNGNLYADSLNMYTGNATLMVTSGDGTWQIVDMTGGPVCDSMRAMQTYGDYLYVGTDNSLQPGFEDSAIWRYSDTTGWEKVAEMPEAVEELVVHDGKLYAGTVYNTAQSEGGVYEINVVAGTVESVGPNVKDTNASVFKLYDFDNTLYMGTANYIDGFELWKLVGDNWTAITTDGFGDSANTYTWSMADLDGTLYLGTFTSSLTGSMESLDLAAFDSVFSSGELWALEDDEWSQIALPSILQGWGLWDYGIRNMEVGDNSLWLGTASNIMAPDGDALAEFLLANLAPDIYANIPGWFWESAEVQAFFARTIGPGTEIWRSQSVQSAPVPEPSTLLLIGSSLVGLAWNRRKKKA